MNLGFYMPTKVIVGKDCVRENSDVFKIGKKALIVTGKKSAKLSGAPVSYTHLTLPTNREV